MKTTRAVIKRLGLNSDVPDFEDNFTQTTEKFVEKEVYDALEE